MRIAVYAFDGITMFHLAVPQMVFDEVRRQGIADWTTALFGDTAGPVRTAEGYQLAGMGGPETAESADIVVIPSWFDDGRGPGETLLAVVRAASERRAAVLGLCLGAIAVADAGLLAGRKAVTHWQAFAAMAERHPDVPLDQSVLYIDHGDVLTSAGTASGLDACLHVVRERLGADAANQVARSLVVAPHREGGQAQYIDRPVPPRSEDDPIAPLLDWALEHLAEPLDVNRLALQAHMTRRTFVRAFRAATGTSPSAWVRSQRLDAARRLLETTDLGIERVAADSGFGHVVTLRENFAGTFGTTPTEYRRRFTTRPRA
ncbi:helix-turn-helix domain-containing protein [Arthrobacter agilis]|uniref:GlxA family transcriptional regulator n=1 Tax=Arthrobacter agilis TaxID=37921 RepID=UPI000B355503|nr:helix-turn-helix domain-containing protein [Arthrobacter agilis]OUM42207.1 AraC family transcriptional regulator [Arthrobacter agilis]PPB45550.1 AraC family transcriptional regulator [Arthrobacter agilis]TPV26471.1 helix-turn-helix domain-containing protein [Arthrobacter agilis]VDR33626.1 Regulatory protein soxS [Arthrobacter agilis]